MGLGGGWDDSPPTATDLAKAERVVEAALEAGIDRFDHADIYTRGKAERVFGEVLRRHPGLRERVHVQGKVGIRHATDDVVGHYDLSANAIRERVEQSLERLGADRLDTLLLHRPDPLMEPDEVAAALTRLHDDGLVGAFGVSNMSVPQVAALQAALDLPLVAHQLEMSLARAGFVEAGITVNRPESAAVDFPSGMVEHCSAYGIELQAWGAMAYGRYSGRPTEDPADTATTELVGRLAEVYDVGPEAVVLGWLMRHPARIAPVIGTTDPGRIRSCGQAEAVAAAMTRVEWYELLTTARGGPVP
jgi:predicted oxidoreductase